MELSSEQYNFLIKRDGKITTKAILELLGKSANSAVIPVGKYKIRMPRNDKYLSEIKLMLKLAGIEFESEYKFCQTRKWRFDVALITDKIAVEYEGIFSKKSRHITHSGFTGDIEKYNMATTLGWKVLRYTAKDYKNVITDLKKILSV